jgi:hypothetical protein
MMVQQRVVTRMSGLLFGVGAFAVAVGAVLIGFGIPINEFSFGNTLILAGATAFVGGLIVVSLGVVVAQLQRLTEALATRAPIRPGRPLDMLEHTAGSRVAPSQVPFPPKPKSDAGIREPQPPDFHTGPSMPDDMPVQRGPAPSFAPTLHNPAESPMTVEDEVSLSPQHPMAISAPAAVDVGEPARHTPSFDYKGSAMAGNRQETPHEPTLEGDWRSPAAPAQTRQPQTAYFDAMWPAEAKPAKNPVDTDAKPYESKFDPPPRETAAAPAHAESEIPKPRPGNETRAVAILKSGVVDGMGYTLYVDGSIEAELPQGTLRFASINELRSHLEKNT